MLVDLQTLDWDDDLLDLFGVDRVVLPRIVSSSERVVDAELLGGRFDLRHGGRPAVGALRPGLLRAGEAKATYGTGSFVLVNVGADWGPTPAGLLKTAAAAAMAAPQQYAVEGAVLSAGAAIQWLRDGLELVDSASETERISLEPVRATACTSFPPYRAWDRLTGIRTRAV